MKQNYCHYLMLAVFIGCLNICQVRAQDATNKSDSTTVFILNELRQQLSLDSAQCSKVRDVILKEQTDLTDMRKRTLTVEQRRMQLKKLYADQSEVLKLTFSKSQFDQFYSERKKHQEDWLKDNRAKGVVINAL